MTTVTATSNADFVTKIGAAGSGDIVQLADGVNFGELTIPSTAGGATVRGISLNHTVTRMYKQSCSNFWVNGVNFQINWSVDDPTLGVDVLPLFGFTGASQDGFRMTECVLRAGLYTDNSDFDVANTAGIYASIIGYGPTNTWPANNPFFDYPTGLGSSAGTLTGSITIEDNDFEDQCNALKFVWAGGAGKSLKVRKNRFYRAYGDSIQFSMGPGAFVAPTALDISGNYFEDCGWCQPQDGQNPHADLIQLESQDDDNPPNPQSTSPVTNAWVLGNFAWYHPTCRGQPQRSFNSDTPFLYPFLGARVVDNVFISRMTDKGVTVSNNGDHGSAYSYVFRNTLLTNPVKNTAVQNEQYTNPNTGAPSQSATDCTISIAQEPTYGGKNFVGRNIVEKINSSAYVNSTSIANAVVPRGTTSTSYQTVLTPPADWTQVDTAEEAFAAFTAKTAYAAYGGIRPGDTLTTFLDRWSNDTKPWSDLPSFVGWRDITNQPQSTVVTTADGLAPNGWCFVHAGMETRAISIVGGEYRTANDQAGTGASGWTSSSGTIADGKYLQVRCTTAAAPGTATNVDVTIGTETYRWRALTLDTTNYPLAVFNGTQLIRQTSAQALGTAASPYGLIAIEFKIPSTPATTQNLFAISASTGSFGIQRLSTGKLRFSFVNAAAGVTARVDTVTNVCNDVKHRVLVSLDTTQASATAGFKIYVDDVDDTGAFGTWNQNVDIAWTRAPGSYQVGGASATPAFVGEVGMLWIGAGQWADLTDQTVRDSFSASNIGATGLGPTGTAPRVFLAGPAAEWNVTNPNQGTGNSFSAFAGLVTADGTDVWPPVLRMDAALETAGPYPAGSPVDILVTPVGYGRALTETATADLTGTWATNPIAMAAGTDGVTMTYTPTQSGTHTISFDNNIGYIDAPDVVFTVASTAPTSFTMSSGYNAIKVSTALTVDFALNSPATTSTTITPASTGAGNWSAATLVLTGGQSTGSLTFTPSAGGLHYLSATNNQNMTNPADIWVSVSTANAGPHSKLRLKR